MSLGNVCRVCLAVGMKSFRIEGSLQIVFEKLTSTALHTAVRKPAVACYVCYAQLNKCHQLMLTSARADNILNQLLQRYPKITTEALCQIDRVANCLCSPLSVASTDCYDSISLPPTPFELKTESETDEVDLDAMDELSDDSLHLPPLVPIHGLTYNTDDFDLSRQQDTKIDIKEELDIGERVGSLKPLDVTSFNVHDTKIDIHDDDLMTKVRGVERDENSAEAVREGQDKKPIQTSESKQKRIRKKRSKGPFLCQFCDLQFRRLSDMKKHLKMKQHDDDKQYICDVCQYKVKHKNALIQHFRIHSDEKPFKCNLCRKRFRQSPHLVKHFRTHSGEKPYECNECQKQFGRRENLISHLCIHSGEKPFKCRLCKRRFKTSGDLKRHCMTHSGEKPHRCVECEQRFRQKGSLKRHMRTHTGEKPYQCDVCALPFNRKSSLLRHHKRKHTQNKKGRRRRTKNELKSEDVSDADVPRVYPLRGRQSQESDSKVFDNAYGFTASGASVE